MLVRAVSWYVAPPTLEMCEVASLHSLSLAQTALGVSWVVRIG